MLLALPKWSSVRLIRKEIKLRFGLGDRNDLDSRLNRCRDFDKKWHQERVDYSKRLNALRAQFEQKIEQAVDLFCGVQKMSDGIVTFEQEENRLRP